MVGKAVVLLLLSALVAVGFARHEDRIREQDRLALIASDLAGRNVGVHCPSFFAKLVDVHGEAGRVQFDAAGRPADHTDLSPETCKELGRFSHVDFSCIDTSSCRYPEFQTAWAAHTLAHESFHLRGIQDEGVTECYALQATGIVAERLGLSPERSGALERWVFLRGYPNEPADYHASGCYDGGPLDLKPPSAAWP